MEDIGRRPHLHVQSPPRRDRHDGKPFTSADVAFTVEELWKKYAPHAPSVFAQIASVATRIP
jgi:hypothetical protein